MVPCLTSEIYLRNRHDFLSKYFFHSPQRYVFLKCNTIMLGKIQTNCIEDRKCLDQCLPLGAGSCGSNISLCSPPP